MKTHYPQSSALYVLPAVPDASGGEKEEPCINVEYQPANEQAKEVSISTLMGIVHEIKTPLSNINLSTSFILAEIGNSNLITYFDIIERSTKRIAQLVSSLLKDASIASLSNAGHSPIPVNDLLFEMIAIAHDKSELKNIKIRTKSDRSSPRIEGNREKILLALSNIINNAIEAVSAGTGVITVKCKIIGDVCKITIADNGVGISKTDLPKVLMSGFTTKMNGNGVGLMVTKKILQEHNATITVKSKKAVGTCFVVTFPAL